MKIAYLDCSSGISGDMFIGALIDAGVPLKHLEKELTRIPLKGYSLRKRSVRRGGIKALKVDVELTGKTEGARKWSDIQKIIGASKLDRNIKDKGMALFKKLFSVEAKVHGKKQGTTHLHELGAVDCIVDIFSVLLGLKYLGIEKVYASPVNVGSGHIHTEHGTMPVPAPATLALLKKAEIYSSDIRRELTTPTGALLLSDLVDDFGEMPVMKVTGYGYGAGSTDSKGIPNILRVIVGERDAGKSYEEIYVVETNIDDMNPQFYHHAMEKLFEAGALDVFLTNVIMKKQRPGVKLTVLVNGNLLEEAMDIVLRETTTIGVRFTKWGRLALQRKYETVMTEFGRVRFKKVLNDKDVLKMYPEYDDCRKISLKTGVPVRVIYDTLKGYSESKRKKR